MKVAVIIPCYNVKKYIEGVISKMGEEVDRIYCVDDKCPEGTGKFIEDSIDDPRVTVLYHEKNKGVGGAVITGYRKALEQGYDIMIKVDGDGQMDPKLIEKFVKPIEDGHADYTKGNRFYNINDVIAMPKRRVIGNSVLSFFTKLSSGYWHMFDPTNGFTAIHKKALSMIQLNKLNRRFFFESDILFRLNIERAVIKDIPMEAVYGDETSNLRILKVIPAFLWGHFKNTFKRIFYTYFLRDFTIASVNFLFGNILMAFGFIFGVIKWFFSANPNDPIAVVEVASAGTVMLAALPFIIGFQMILSFFNTDMMQTYYLEPLQKE